MATLLLRLSDRGLRILQVAARRAGVKAAEAWLESWAFRLEAGVDRYIRHDETCEKLRPRGPGAQRCTCGLDTAWGRDHES